MSHIATVDVHVTDLAALKAACAELGIEFREGQQTFRWYGAYLGGYPLPEGFTAADMGKCEHAIGIPGNTHAYEVGVVRRRDGKPGYHLMYDFWRGGFGLEEQIGTQAGKLRQQYAAQVAANQARKQGYRVTQSLHADGSLRLVCTRG
jgi:hypothetical protein